VLSVALQRPAPAAAEPAVRPEAKANPVTPAERPARSQERARPPTDAAPTAAESVPATSRPPERVVTATPPALTTATLLSIVREADWRAPLLPDEPDETPAHPGRAWPRAWDRPVLATEANRFDDAYLPGETEILDRWRAADGAHEVVMRTPTGHTLCGRAAAWNPMEPLVEPIMLFRPCGGGGKRTFRPGVVRDDR
jgi:hypothetical protein